MAQDFCSACGARCRRPGGARPLAGTIAEGAGGTAPGWVERRDRLSAGRRRGVDVGRGRAEGGGVTPCRPAARTTLAHNRRNRSRVYNPIVCDIENRTWANVVRPIGVCTPTSPSGAWSNV